MGHDITRSPSTWAQEHYRETMARLGDRMEAQRGVEPRSAEGEALAYGHRAFETAGVAVDFAELVGFEMGMAPTLFGLASPVIGLVATLHELGEANHAAEKANVDRHVARSFAAGVAAALDPDPAYASSRPPREPSLRAAWDRGQNFVDSLTPLQRRNLEDVLVLGHRAASGHGDYDPATYAGAIMDVYEKTWRP